MTQNQAPRLVLILGGARSGKSTFAEQLALSSGKRVAFIATATVSDADMRDRIARHRASRPAEWTTIEEPLNLVQAVQQATADVILLDCMTLWLSNWMGQYGGMDEEDDVKLRHTYTESVLAAIEVLLTTIKTLDAEKTLIVVSNEVGLGIVPMHPLSRVYRDVLGWVNQRIARDADRVYLMIAGLAVDIKKLQEEVSPFSLSAGQQTD
ncbi:MAG: bifunctional adenosylcobinamide kinase/adenosylcobinamide-phosphate guanylyltransferase [Ktedonobacteraceae bacterium]